MNKDSDTETNINQFRQKNFYKKYESWVDSFLFPQFYNEAVFSEEGEMISEPSFDDDCFEQVKKNSLCNAFRSFYTQKSDDYIPLVSDVLKVNVSTSGDKISEPVLLATLFCILLVELETAKGWKYPILCSWENELSKAFYELGMLHEWLQFYAVMSSFMGRLSLPKALDTPEVHDAWLRLQKAGFIDDKYQFIRKVNTSATKYAIAIEIKNRTKCTWQDLERHFKVTNFRAFADEYTSAEKRISDKKPKNDEDKSLTAIETCFKTE